MSYNVINLEDLYNSKGEKDTRNLFEDFECPLNKDVEYFIKNKAIEFSKQGIAKTYIVSTSYKNKQVIVGYFSLTNKITEIKKNIISSKMRKRLARFAINDELNKSYSISLPLIGQLGKNYKNTYNNLISGDILLKLACDKIREVQKILGGKFVMLECEDKEKLKEFYENNGFVCFGKRNLEKDEREKNSGEYLLQMLCYLNDKK